MNDISLSQKQIILGGLLGDSSFYKKSKYVSFSHSEKQFDYLKWKHNFLDNVSDIKSTYNTFNNKKCKRNYFYGLSRRFS